MGTNYYINKTDYHIGKSSAGWCFSLHVKPEDGINSLKDVRRLWRFKVIRDEYGSTISKKEMVSIITNRSWECKGAPLGYCDWNEFHKLNHSEAGSDGLLRHKIDGTFCIGHGDGTYDYLIGEFS